MSLTSQIFNQISVDNNSISLDLKSIRFNKITLQQSYLKN